MEVELPSPGRMGGLTCLPSHGCPQLHGLTFPPPVVHGTAGTQTPCCSSEQWTTPNAPEATALPEQVGVKKWWKLVWCHERCYKEENEKRCHGLRQSLQATGGTLVCQKKAAKFAHWLELPVIPAYVLVTDWREAQHCAEYLKQGLTNGSVPSDRMPLGIVVICLNGKQHRRATKWAEQVSPSLGLVLAVNINHPPPASLSEPLRSVIYDNFANLSAGTRQQQQQPQGAGPCLTGLEGGETRPTSDSDNTASEGEEDFLETPTKIEEASSSATFDGAEGHADLQGLPPAKAVDWVADGPDAHLIAILQRYGMVGGKTMPIERIYADMTMIRL